MKVFFYYSYRNSTNGVTQSFFSLENIRPRRSTRPSALKLFGIAELSEAFGISLDSDSDSDQEFAPTKGIDSSMYFTIL